MKNKVLVTGSAGFIGSKLVPALINKGHEIIELDLKNGFDLTNWESVKQIRKFDVIIHLAARVFVPDSYKFPREFYDNNIVSTLNMLELCKRTNSRMIYISSYVYGKPQYFPIDEKHPVSALNPYAQSKIISEQLCKGYNRDFGVPVIIFRPFNIYGLGQNENFLIPLILKQIHEQGEVHLKDSRPKRDFIHVDDVVKAYCKAVEYNKTDFDIFNLSTGVSYSVKEIAEILVKNSGEEVKIEFTEEQRENEILNTVADIKKVKDRMDWQPIISIEEGLSKLLSS